MRKTKDAYTGERFDWNTTALAWDERIGKSVIVPARCTSDDFHHMHPSRVLPKLLAELNAELNKEPE